MPFGGFCGYSLLILNMNFRTTPEDLFPYFDKYGEVMDVFIPKDKRTGESRGFEFLHYKHQDEAQKAIDRIDVIIQEVITTAGRSLKIKEDVDQELVEDLKNKTGCLH